MKKLITLAFTAAIFLLAACDDEEVQTIDSSMPNGNFMADVSGTFVEQNGTGSMGTAEIGMDDDGTSFLRFSDNFNSNFGTGTITVYLSKTNEDLTEVFDPMNGNPDLILVGGVTSAGEKFFKLDAAPSAEFDHVILWCASANIPFGYAMLN